ncbi:MAG: DEAD/DEAH box helicase, partial [Beijerinckiaceae bacterium]
MTQFTDFPLAAPIQKALVAEGYTKPTPIQSQTIPMAIAGRDILGIAQTGTGKTAAFALPILNRLGRTTKPRIQRTVRALILSPTRELASQICESFRTYGRDLGLKTDVIFGGVPIGKQQRLLLPGLDILVATPGRLLDLIDRRAVTLQDIEVLVLDEADQMLDLGFIHALKRIVPMLPKKRQSMFFSATMPKTISGLADSFLDNPVKVAVTPVATTAERVTQGVMFVQTVQKQALLHAVLRDEAIERVLVFTRTKHGADKVVKHLDAASIEAQAIHGNKSQGQRERALKAFRDGNCRVLVATDIAARGIDVDGVTHVINFELPNVPEAYVHRIGRTARAGASGIAISFCANEERPFLRDIERTTRVSIPMIAMPDGVDLKTPLPKIEIERHRDPRAGQGRPQNGQRRRNDAAPHSRAEGRAEEQRPSRGGPRRSNGGSKPQGESFNARQGFSPRGEGGFGG